MPYRGRVWWPCAAALLAVTTLAPASAAPEGSEPNVGQRAADAPLAPAGAATPESDAGAPAPLGPPAQEPALDDAAAHRALPGHARAVGLGLASTALTLLPFTAVLLPPDDPSYPLAALTSLGAMLAAPLPTFWADPWTGAGVSLIAWGSFAGAVALSSSPDLDARQAGALLANVAHHQGMYAAYAAYRDVRSRSDGGKTWRPHSAADLLVAPLKPSNLRHTVVWLPLLVDVGLVAVTVASSTAPRDGRTVAIQAGRGLLASVVAGVTEEALFRGFLYEELKSHLGTWPARALDMTLFALVHVPQDRTQPLGTIAAGIASRALVALLLEIAYDVGGLPAAVALHTLHDVILTAGIALAGGVAPAQTRGVRPAEVAITVPVAAFAF